MYKLEIFKDKEKVNEIMSQDKATTERELLKVYKNYWEYKTKYRPFKSVNIHIKPYSDEKELTATVKMYFNASEHTVPIYTYKYYFDLREEV